MIEYYDLRKKIEFYLVGTLILVAVIYGGFKGYPLLAGPNIELVDPLDGEVVSSTTFQVSGKVKRVKEITLQGRQIPIDTNGEFKETLVPQMPYTILILSATDFYGKTITKMIRVIPK